MGTDLYDKMITVKDMRNEEKILCAWKISSENEELKNGEKE